MALCFASIPLILTPLRRRIFEHVPEFARNSFQIRRSPRSLWEISLYSVTGYELSHARAGSITP